MFFPAHNSPLIRPLGTVFPKVNPLAKPVEGVGAHIQPRFPSQDSFGHAGVTAMVELAEVLTKGRVEFVDEVDIKGYFDLQHPWLLKMLAHRIADGALLGLIAKWLKAGILEEDGQIVNPVTGTPQGGSVSPVLANVYLHYVLDLWFEHKVLARKYRGYWNYYGVRGNFKSLGQFFQQTRRILHKWLNRRSQRKSYTALGFERLLRRFQIPHPRIVEIVEKEPVPIRRDPVGVEAALDVLFGRNNHPPSRA